MDVEAEAPGRLAELRTSARGWHGVQLAVLGFIGLCGVLQGDAGNEDPRWLQVLAGLLVLFALVVACTATALVASAAWPVYGSSAPSTVDPDEHEIRRTSRRLRAGIALTFVAVTALALGAASSWWPAEGRQRGAVEVTTSGGVLCGTLQGGQAGGLVVDVAGRPVLVQMADITQLRPLDNCP